MELFITLATLTQNNILTARESPHYKAPSIQRVSSEEPPTQDALNKPRKPGRDERQQKSVRRFAHPLAHSAGFKWDVLLLVTGYLT